jgi:hypothetical protein
MENDNDEHCNICYRSDDVNDDSDVGGGGKEGANSLKGTVDNDDICSDVTDSDDAVSC